MYKCLVESEIAVGLTVRAKTFVRPTELISSDGHHRKSEFSDTTQLAEMELFESVNPKDQTRLVRPIGSCLKIWIFYGVRYPSELMSSIRRSDKIVSVYHLWMECTYTLHECSVKCTKKSYILRNFFVIENHETFRNINFFQCTQYCTV